MRQAITLIFLSSKRLRNAAFVLAPACAAVYLVSFSPAFAQPPTRDGEEAKSEAEDFAAVAYGLPPEFGADLLIRLSKQASVGKGKRREMLVDAFRIASGASRRFPTVYLGRNGDTRAGYSQFASELGMDALSLQSRAIDAMAAISVSDAIALLAEVDWPEIPPGGCESASAPDLAIYYDVLIKVAEAPPPPSPRARQALEEVLRRRIARIGTNSEATAAARLLISLPASRELLAELLSTYGGAIETLRGDLRSFIHFSRKGSDNFYPLLLRALSVEAAIPLARSLRTYVVNNLNSEYCKDLPLVRRTDASGSAPNSSAKPGNRAAEAYDLPMVQSFHQDIRRIPGLIGAIPEIASDDVRPQEPGKGSKDFPYWQSPSARRFLMEVRQLANSVPGKSSDPIEAQERLNRIRDFLKDLEDWKPTAEDSFLDHFHQKSVLYLKAIELTDGASRNLVLTDFLHHLERSYERLEDKAEWFCHMAPVLEGLHGKQDYRSAIAERCLRSPNPVLAAYSKFFQDFRPR
ncbi:MAG: hypothetical protein ACOYX1_10495 [Acidobacteriota bacterium]